MTWTLDAAVNARDPRFDGVFFVGVTTTRIYCRPVCPSRIAQGRHRRFFDTAAAAESAGFRPCLRCRPELAPGRALCDAVSRLAHAAVHRISSGALNGRSVEDLARELDVSERHLRRALERAIGVSPLELAQTHRLLLAKRLLADTDLPVTDIAYASGFQSLRRFNTVFRERYGMSPTALRRGPRRSPRADFVRLTLAYRPPLDWDSLLGSLAAHALPAEVIEGRRYSRTVTLEGRTGVVFAEDADGQLDVDVSLSLLPVLMPLLARLRRLFDLDAEPATIEASLAQNGLGEHVRARPGLRIPGAFDAQELLLHLAPAAGTVKLGPGSDPVLTKAALLCIEGVDERIATTIVMRALHWPDAFPRDDPAAEPWRPWRSYAALHLGLL
jgi:AraC family transcriptional regulator, regulatory protein of adaptative response / DNA-3-methyladenine glycosylase II